MPYRVLDHTADTGIEATAHSLAGVIEEAARAMFALMAFVEPSAAEHWVESRVESPTLEDLIVDTLSDLLFLSETKGLLFSAFRVAMEEGNRALGIEAGGVPIGSVTPSGPPIKAVTYHRLLVEQRDHEWLARVYFDV